MIGAVGVARSFGGRPVLRDLDLQVRRGEVYGLLGANGAGKTTAINVMTGLIPADAGEVTLEGGPGGSGGVIGVAPQEAAVYPLLSCVENLLFFGGLYGLRGSALRDRADAVIESTRLQAYRDARAATLSGGTRRRLNLAVAMVHDPGFIILDEPTAGLDMEARHAVWAVIRGLRRTGASVLLTSHLLDEVAELCDRIGLLHGGRIAREGTLDELRASVPAAQVAEAESDDDDALSARAAALGLTVRRRGGRIVMLLPEPTSLESLVDDLRGTGIRSISMRPVGLEDVFFDVTGDPASSSPASAGRSSASSGGEGPDPGGGGSAGSAVAAG